MAEIHFSSNPCLSCGKHHVVFPGGLGRCGQDNRSVEKQ